MNKVKQAESTCMRTEIVFVLCFGIGVALFAAFLPGWLANFIIAPMMAERLAFSINVLSAFMGGMACGLVGVFIQMVVWFKIRE